MRIKNKTNRTYPLKAAVIFCTAAILNITPAHSGEILLVENGSLTVAATAAFPPIVSVDDKGKYVGIDADIIEAIAKEIGLKVQWVNIKFDGIIPGIGAGRFDVGMTGITDTVERQQAVDFVDYANVGSGLIVQAGNPKSIQKLEDICGLIVASQTGDLATTYARRQSDKCVSDGQKPVVVNEFPEATQSMLQLMGGRADLIMHDYPLSAYKVAHSDGKMEIAGAQFAPAPYGMAIRKNNENLRNALMDGLNAIIKSGEYADILEKYKVSEIAISKAAFNAAAK